MKNQYFADINDYRKYGLLGTLADGSAFKTTVWRMLTPADQREVGIFTSYLDNRDRRSHYDPELFDLLKSCMAQPAGRSVQRAETTGIIPGATYYSKSLYGQPDERQRYFHERRDIAAGQDLVFFDPDNGIEVKSVSCRSMNSDKYVH
jgi:hypothetical protein